MTDQEATEPVEERRGVGVVGLLATVLFGLLVGAAAWLLLLAPDAPRGTSKPATVMALPQATIPIAPPPSQPEPAIEPPAAIAEPAPPPIESAAAPAESREEPSIAEPPPPSEAPATVAAAPPPPEVVVPAAPPVAAPPPPSPAQAAPTSPVSPPARPVPAAREADRAPAPSTAPSTSTDTAAIIPPPPSYQPTPRGIPAPAPDGLAPAPDPNLLEPGRDGPLPMVGKDGRKPWQVYARPFDANDPRPRIALIISGLGQSTAATEAAIQRLPGAVTLAFTPYAKNLDQWIALARAAGHEVLLTVPMEPIGYPENDPGPHTLLTTISDRDNRDRLLFLLSRFTGYVGVLNSMGARLTTAPQSLRPVLQEIRDRGLIFVDTRSSLRSVAASQATELGLPRAINNRFIDIKAARVDIDQRLEELERVAKSSGNALGIGSPYPVTIERVALWAQELEKKGFALAPVSAVVDRQPD